MKKKLFALATSCMMALSFTGCSAEGTSYLKETEKVMKWEATEQSGSMTMSIDADDVEGKLTLDYTAYSVNSDVQAELTMTAKSLEMNGATLDLTKGDYKLSPAKFYMDGAKFYMPSSAIKEVAKMAKVSEEDINSVVEVSKDYVAFDMTDTYTEMGVDIKEVAKDSKELLKVFDDIDVEVPIKQEGRKYTIELTADDMVAATVKMMVQSLESQKEVLEAQYKELGLTDEQIKATMDELANMANDETVKELAELIKGSKVTYVEEFADDQVKADMDVKFSVNLGEDTVSFQMTANATSKKAAKKAIKMPTSVTTYTMNELMEKAAAVEAETTEATEEAAEEATEETTAETTKEEAAEAKKAA